MGRKRRWAGRANEGLGRKDGRYKGRKKMGERERGGLGGVGWDERTKKGIRN